jgi:Kef-type K+ transport system membrane component KefB
MRSYLRGAGLALFVFFACSETVWSSEGGMEPGLGSVLPALVILLLAAKLGGHLMELWGQPAVLGELFFGVVLGNLALLHLPYFEVLKDNSILNVLAEIGVLLLLFEVGLESTVADMMKVGVSSLLVALLGVAGPFVLGWGVSAWLLPAQSLYVHIFIGATLTATSVGITARVLKDLGRQQDRESRIILGAAVIDDVLGLVILAVVSGVIAAANSGSESVGTWSVAWIVGKALLFLVGAVVAGAWVVPKLFKAALRLRGQGVQLTFALIFCFTLAQLAVVSGLAAIVGAFAAGLLLEEVHLSGFRARGERKLSELIHPLAVFLTPIFFVRMGLYVDLRSFTHADVLTFAGALTGVAILGKQLAALGVTERGLNRLAVGLGMIPRGEVGLIFASIGASLTLGGAPVISPAVYSAVVIMVIITTMVTPPLLKWGMSRVRS